jgi:ubiquinone/menaquinone biosynthesis C-methylase UbiE
MTSAWSNDEIPPKQRGLVQQSLDAMYHGEDMEAYRILAEILKPNIYPGCSILELGCSSGYCYEMLEYYLNTQINYTGIDYSEAMIAMARDYYPMVKFFIADGANLFFSDRKYETVISSCILLHVPNYRKHIFETTRVADKFVVASRTPICKRSATRFLKKNAYGVETVELVFNEEEFISEFILNRFSLDHAVEYQSDSANDVYETTYLFNRV